MNKKDEEIIGVIKRIDSLGRIVIPKEFRERFLLDKNIEVLLTKEGVLLRNPRYVLTEIKSENN